MLAWMVLSGFHGFSCKINMLRASFYHGSLNLTTLASGRDVLGSGGEPVLTDLPTAGRPNFVVKKAWLENASGAETYTFILGQTIKMKARFKNDGDANAPRDIETRFYLSIGYKEDPHDQWQRKGRDIIKAGNLERGETHTETESLTTPAKPGIYNIVSCADRTLDDHNGSGVVVEKHESDNCSTEIVFTVEAPAIQATDSGSPILRLLQMDAL